MALIPLIEEKSTKACKCNAAGNVHALIDQDCSVDISPFEHVIRIVNSYDCVSAVYRRSRSVGSHKSN